MNLKIFRPRARSPVAALAPAGLYVVEFAYDQIEQPKPALGIQEAHRELQTTEGQRCGQEKVSVFELCG